MSIGKTETKVYFYKNDYNRVCEEIYHHQHIETGGNLFGLWTTKGNIVVHAVLGPGKKCKRTDVSFHQDIEYMSQVGTFLNTNFMLCHIGEWHSHHQLRLNEPSAGDERTVRQNYPKGVKKFLVIIGNIVGKDRVILSPYFFSENGNICEKGEFKVLDNTDSPYTTDSMIVGKMNEGAENPNVLYCSSSPNKEQQCAPESSSSPQLIATDISSNSGNQSPGKVPQNTAQPSSSASYANAIKGGSAAPANKNSSAYPPRDYPATNSSSASEAASDGNNKQTRKEAISTKVFDEIKSRFDDSGIELERPSSGVIEMKFKHKNLHWLIMFPQSFPEKPASIFTALSEKFSDVTKSRAFEPEFLNNYFDILLAIKNKCREFSSSCSPCKEMNVQNLALSDRNLDFFLTEEGNAMIKQLCDKAKDTLADAGTSLKKEMKCDDMGKQNAILEVSFTHSSMLWIIKVSSTFPSCPAMVSCKNERDCFGGFPGSVYCESNQYSSKDWAIMVLAAIAKRCETF